MKITIITLFPKMVENFFSESIVKRAIDNKNVNLKIVNPRDYSSDKYKTVDDRPYGGGVGMVLKVEPIYLALKDLKIKEKNKKIILTSPRGIKFNQDKAKEYSDLENLVIICGHYEGFDERIMDFVDEEVSVGDYVLTGGEIPSCLISDAVIRLLPSVLKKKEATEIESFFKVDLNELIESVGEDECLLNLKKQNKKIVSLLEYPQYTRPEIFLDKKVPEILLSGDPKKINQWKIKKAFEITKTRRKDLLI